MQDLDQSRTEDVSGGAMRRPPLTTMAIGEEGGTWTFGEDITTMAFGEEGCIPPKGPVLTTAGSLGAF